VHWKGAIGVARAGRVCGLTQINKKYETAKFEAQASKQRFSISWWVKKCHAIQYHSVYSYGTHVET